MTVQDMINKLNEIDNKSKEIKFIFNKTLENLIIVDDDEDTDEYNIFLEFDD